MRKRAGRTGDARMRGAGLKSGMARAGPALSARTDGESTKLIKQMLDGDLAVNGTKGGWWHTRSPACSVSCAREAGLACSCWLPSGCQALPCTRASASR